MAFIMGSLPQIFVEYVMLARVNDNPIQAHQLGQLLGHRPEQYMVNLIPWNPVYSPDISFEAPGPERLDEFHRIVRSHGLHCTVRREMGQEIEGAPPTHSVHAYSLRQLGGLLIGIWASKLT